MKNALDRYDTISVRYFDLSKFAIRYNPTQLTCALLVPKSRHSKNTFVRVRTAVQAFSSRHLLSVSLFWGRDGIRSYLVLVVDGYGHVYVSQVGDLWTKHLAIYHIAYRASAKDSNPVESACHRAARYVGDRALHLSRNESEGRRPWCCVRVETPVSRNSVVPSKGRFIGRM